MSSSTPTPPPKSLLPFDVLFDNPVFAGGAGLAGLGAAAALGRRGVIAGAGMFIVPLGHGGKQAKMAQ